MTSEEREQLLAQALAEFHDRGARGGGDPAVQQFEAAFFIVTRHDDRELGTLHDERLSVPPTKRHAGFASGRPTSRN